MATDVERLIVTLEAQTAKYEKALQRARAQTNTQLAAAEARIKRFNSVGASLGASFSGSIRSNVAGIGAAISSALTVDKIIEYSDSWTNLENRLRAVGVESKDLAKVQQDILDIANRSRAAVGDVGQLYSKLALSSKELGASQSDIARVTETVSKALKLGGASAQETSAAILQLGQALASGRLQGDELRSLLENAPLLAQKLAQNLGVGVGELKEMGAAGKLLSGDVFRALLQSSNEIDESFKRTKTTFSDYFTALNNGITQTIANYQKLFGVTEAQAEAQRKAAERFAGLGQGQATSLAFGGGVDRRGEVQGPVYPPELLQAQQQYLASQDKINKITPYANKLFTDLEVKLYQVGVNYREVDDVALKFQEGMSGNADSAVSAATSLEALAQKFPQLRSQLNPLIEALRSVTAEIYAMKTAADTYNGFSLPEPAKNNFRGALDAQEVAAQDAAKKKYLLTLEREASLTDKQIRYEQQLAKVRDDAAKKGVMLTEQEMAAAANAQIAQQDRFRKSGGGGNSTANTFAQVQLDFATQAKETEALSQAFGMLTTTGNAAEVQLELIKAALLSGVPMTDQMRASIEQLALATGAATDRYQQMQESAQAAAQFQQQLATSFQEAFMSIIDGSGNAADAFKNMAKQILAQIIKMQLQAAFGGGATGGATGGGFLSSLFGGIFGGPRAMGGPVSAGKAYLVGERGPELFAPNNSGKIIPNKAIARSGSGGANVKVMNFAGAQVETKTKRGRGGQQEVEILVTEIGKRIAEGNFDKQFRSRFGVGPRVVER